MSDLLRLAGDSPRRTLAPGDVLIQEGGDTSQLYVLVSGSLTISRSGQTISVVAEEGAVFGEVSALLDTEATATVVASEATGAEVAVVDDPIAFMTAQPDALLGITRTLADRLNQLTIYLADLSQQYGSSGGNLGLVDEVLSRLALSPPPPVESGSEREPDPEY